MATHPGWYHTIDLAPGVATPGLCDLRGFLPRVLPADLGGRRCLDVGTFDGFYAFAMEERGAAEVVGIDVDSAEELEHPPQTRAANLADARASGLRPGEGFRRAAAVRGSRARRVALNVYALDAAAIGGQVDFAVVGTILQHLRDPVRALERVRDVLVPGGRAVLVETVSVRLSVLHRGQPVADFRPGRPGNRFSWWVPNLALLGAWARSAGLEPAPGRPALHRPVRGAGRGDWLAAVRVQRSGGDPARAPGAGRRDGAAPPDALAP